MEREIEQLRSENAKLTKQKILSQTNNGELKNLQLRVETAELKRKKARGLLLAFMAR